jgi:hypothetical protein
VRFRALRVPRRHARFRICSLVAVDTPVAITGDTEPMKAFGATA